MNDAEAKAYLKKQIEAEVRKQKIKEFSRNVKTNAKRFGAGVRKWAVKAKETGVAWSVKAKAAQARLAKYNRRRVASRASSSMVNLDLGGFGGGKSSSIDMGFIGGGKKKKGKGGGFLPDLGL